MNDIQINKIKYSKKDEKTTIEYEKHSSKIEGAFDEHKIISWDDPLDSFLNTLNALKPHVFEICEFEGDEDDLEIKGVSFSWTQGIMGAVITACKSLTTSNSPLVLNTPHLPSEDYSGSNPEALILSRDAIDDLEALIEEAKKYIKGERKVKQLSLV